MTSCWPGRASAQSCSATPICSSVAPVPDGVELVNPGSVGMPFDGDQRAAYALVREDGSLEHRRVAYDHERSAAAMTERFGDAAWALRSATRLRTARA